MVQVESLVIKFAISTLLFKTLEFELELVVALHATALLPLQLPITTTAAIVASW